MRIQHNIMAMNAYRNYNNNTSALSKNLEKLSSGYKINRAGDDAAGLAISEKMRAQITGLETAQKNAKDGISLVQTAEGALTEVHDMLNRMVELATQSANGTYKDEVDRENLEAEVNALKEEINRISKASNFNGINLLDGSLGGAEVTSTAGVMSVDAVPGTAGAVPTTANATTATVTGQDGNGSGQKATLTMDLAGMSITAPTDGSTGAKAEITIAGQKIELEVTGDMAAKDIRDALVGKTITINGTTLTAKAGSGDTGLVFEAADDTSTNTDITTAAGSGISITGTAGTVGGSARVDGSASTAELDFSGRVGADLIGGSVQIGDKTYSFVENAADAAAGTEAVVLTQTSTAAEIAQALADAGAADAKYTFAVDGNGAVTVTEVGVAAGDTSGKQNFSGEEIKVKFANVGMNLQVGDTADTYNKIKVSIDDMSTDGLGISNISVANQTAASDAIDMIKKAINTVSSVRGGLGATQNRLDHTINNLSVMTENIQDAESTIRDTDVADEMMAYTKNNILIQSAQAMLAQANQVPQGVLQLLQ